MQGQSSYDYYFLIGIILFGLEITYYLFKKAYSTNKRPSIMHSVPNIISGNVTGCPQPVRP
ncbi:MAG: hypothetical protein ACFFBY_10355 [Promethearchaeota archaeon]